MVCCHIRVHVVPNTTEDCKVKLYKDGILAPALILLMVATLLIAHACASVGKRHDSSIGNVMYDTNPLMYQAAYIAQGDNAVTNVDGNLNMRLAPLGTYMLYDESVLFCGLPVDMFRGKKEPFVLTYERAARRVVRGLGCHTLVRVDSMQAEKVQ